ncbi:MAG: hypothetical protein U0166_05290 [Acidobacteriota bacterium]
MRKSIVAMIVVLGRVAYGGSIPMRALTLEERVAATEAIERIFEARRIWPSDNTNPRPSFESRFPRSLIEARVRDDLRKGSALDAVWHRPITTAQLQAEMDRIVAQTRDVATLEAIFRALGDDPVLVAECLVRPVLTDRLLSDWYASDRSLHAGVRARAERAQGELSRETFASYPEGVLSDLLYATGDDLDVANVEDCGAPDRIDVTEKELRIVAAEMGPADGSVRLLEREDCFQLLMVASATPSELSVLIRTFPKESRSIWWDRVGDTFSDGAPCTTGTISLRRPSSAAAPPACDQWDQASDLVGPPDGRYEHSAIWTGSEMIVWGGSSNGVGTFKTGGRYTPATDTWRATPTDGACPSPRRGHTAVWTGTEMIVWGGTDQTPYNPGGLLDTGGRYDPLTDTWTPTTTSGLCPPARAYHTAVWTGSRMLVWGAVPPFDGGGQYDPATDTWTPLTTAGSPSSRSIPTAVWTGSSMIVWGGEWAGVYFDTGGRYDPVSNTWSPTSLSNAPVARSRHSAVWTGSEMIVWGGVGGNGTQCWNSGGRYDPVNDVWTTTSTAGACPSARFSPAAAWSGTEMIVWGGEYGTPGVLSSGGRYSPSSDSWTATSTAGGCPTARSAATAVWSGSELIVWGGKGMTPPFPWNGGRYDPATDSWVGISRFVSPRWDHTAVWTGNEMIVWGGRDGTNTLQTGARYVLATDAWAATTTSPSCPTARRNHTAVWTGSEMVVWGGSPGPTATGARYDPALDSWTPTSTGGACPAKRTLHSAVWTGSEMIVWGGMSGGVPLQTGGRYSPATDTWSATSTAGSCPSTRRYHCAVWTGAEMIIWGGLGTSTSWNTGGRYDPATDAWSPTSTSGACPSPRHEAKAVWTGSEMIAWGGMDLGPNVFETGGRYSPSLDAWTSTSTGGACPSARARHVAVWSGSEMIVWGGIGVGPYVMGFDTGGRYDPTTDLWTATSTGSGCPSPRNYHTAVVAGSAMIVWGGNPSNTLEDPLGTGGLYRFLCPLPVDYLVGAGLGQPNPPSVVIFTPAGAPAGVSIPAYGVSQWGANVASGDINGGVYDDIVTGPGPGDVFGPHVRGWDRAGTALAKVSFYAYGTLKYGVNVASGNLDADPYGEMLTGAGPGQVFGPHVRGFNFDNAAVTAIGRVSFYAYGTLKYGVNVATGSLDGDPGAEIATGPGPGPTFSPQVRGFDYDGTSVSAIAKINYNSLPYAGYGVNVALGDVDFDSYAEIASTPGPGPTHPWRYVGHDYDASSIAPLPGFDVIPFAGSLYGGRVGSGDVEPDGRDELLVGAGRDPNADSTVRAYRYTVTQQLQKLPTSFTPFLLLRYGVNVAAGDFGY